MAIQAGALIDIADFADTGQTSLTGLLETGYTSADLEVSRVGETVFIQGQVTPTTNWGSAMSANTVLAVGDLVAQFCPSISHAIICASSTTASMINFRVTIQSNGAIVVRCDTASHTGNVFIDHTYRGAPL